MFLPNALLKALAQVRPEGAMAEGSGAVWTMQVSGNHDDGSPFITAMFTYAGGVGARCDEARARCLLLSDRCRRRPDRSGRSVGTDPLHDQGVAGGVGRRWRPDRWARPDDRVRRRHDPAVGAQRRHQPARRTLPQGIFGGEPGDTGSFLVNGDPVRTQARITLQPDDIVTLRPPRRRRIRRAGRRRRRGHGLT